MKTTEWFKRPSISTTARHNQLTIKFLTKNKQTMKTWCATAIPQKDAFQKIQASFMLIKGEDRKKSGKQLMLASQMKRISSFGAEKSDWQYSLRHKAELTILNQNISSVPFKAAQLHTSKLSFMQLWALLGGKWRHHRCLSRNAATQELRLCSGMDCLEE